MDGSAGERAGRPIGAARTRGAPGPDRAALYIVLLFSCGTCLSAVLQRRLLENLPSAHNAVELSVGEAFGLAAILSLAFAGSRGRLVLSGLDIAILIVAALAWFVPEQHGIYLAMTLAGGWFVSRRRADRTSVDIGQIWLALSVYELWGKLLFKLCYQVIEVAEVGMISLVGRGFYGRLHVDGASLSVRDDWSIVILEGCSSFHNLSLTVVIWLSILKIAAHGADRAAFRALGLSACLVVAINVARILAMLPSPASYAFWHDGLGSTLVALGSVLAAIVPIARSVQGRAGCLGAQLR
ncbi:hypothetical protein [Methylobacterium sp. J-070]|uniref:hypothetical protein n=1 Tax=Methylobacterium sp. J-070 TaxID=2836650 RepID=UPI001FB916AE|nr:hypothetical protein [Methylobacterium sp. J-070]MCJ2052889.1 hypothetical protein [Methylobacterium sp. J-070]